MEKLGCHMQTRQPVTLPPFNEPQPDGAIVIGGEDEYLQRKPGARDVTCVIEVADSSLNYDRAVKLPIYANSGIPVDFLINLKDHVIEVYSEPRVGTGQYGKVETLVGPQLLRFPAVGGAALSVPARQLLP